MSNFWGAPRLATQALLPRLGGITPTVVKPPATTQTGWSNFLAQSPLVQQLQQVAFPAAPAPSAVAPPPKLSGLIPALKPPPPTGAAPPPEENPPAPPATTTTSEGTPPVTAPEAKVTYTPDGIARQPGYYNPSNPYDTGRHNEQNAERNGGRGSKLPGWDYDNGRPLPGTQLGSDGMYVLGGGGGGGGIPGGGDWESILANDPLINQLKQDLTAQSVEDAAARKAAVQRAIISFGVAPDLTGPLQALKGDIDEGTLDLARNNQFSIAKRLQQQFEDARQRARTSLRQRGALRSGESGYEFGRTQRGFDTSQYDSLQQLLDYLSGAQQNWVLSERQRQAMLYQALLAALQRQLALGAGGGGGASGGGGAPGAYTGPLADLYNTANAKSNDYYGIGQPTGTVPGYVVPDRWRLDSTPGRGGV